jgi:hypothetical protein
MRRAHKKGRRIACPQGVNLEFVTPRYITLGAFGAFHQGAGSNRLSSMASSTVAVMMAIKEIISIIV